MVIADAFISAYRYGFNGMEKDEEVKSDGNHYTTMFRQYDARLGRWLSLDPLTFKFPWQSPYTAFDNNPVCLVDPKGILCIWSLIIQQGGLFM